MTADAAQWSPVVVALVAAVPPTILALATFISSWRNGKQLNVVHAAVNSTATTNVAELKAAREEITALRVALAHKDPPQGG